MNYRSLLHLVIFVISVLSACKPSKTELASAFEQQQSMSQSSPYNNVNWRAIGPDVISGRVTDVEGIPGDSNIIYAGFATSGLWKTTDAGENWLPLFDDHPTLSIGDIAIAPSNKDIVYVGTGEANIFRASLPGKGLFKTMDGGKTFTSVGLEHSGTIARILVHPKDPNIVYAAASGNEWKYNQDRGIYKTMDGGKTWQKIHYIDDKTGCIDIVMDPSNPDVIYASMWNRIRKRFSDPQPEDGDFLYKTSDGGKSWQKIHNGLPDTKNTGRIGIAISASKPNVLYAFVDDHNIKRAPLPNETDSYERSVQKVVIGGAIYRSEDSGATWSKRGEVHDFFKPFSGTYGWVFSQIRVHPTNPDQIYALGVNMGKSNDGGKTWQKVEAKNTWIHGDNHGLWFDPKNPDRIVLGNDGGVSITYNNGSTWRNFFDKMQTTQFYTISYDMATPFNVMGAVQDEGTYSASSAHTFGVKDTIHRQWQPAPGGEGTQICIDPRNENIVFSCSYYGRLMKSDMSKPDSLRSSPIKLFDVGRIDSLRGEWLAGTIISKHNPNVIYHGLQHVYKSKDHGATWKKISGDLTYNDAKRKGVYPYLIYHQAITTIAEGEKPGILYVGTDDGRVWLTTNDGAYWKEITVGLPSNKHIIKITPSRFDPNTVYIAVNDRRQDNDECYLFKSTDQGNTWTSISSNIPPSPANVIIEDIDTKGSLYAGTDMGVYFSKNDGKTWTLVRGNLPAAVSVNDMFIHPRDKKLVIATYGRGVYILDNLNVLKK
jgi:photosystem II stability/assembly factor-like uncharacterized protein